MASRFSGWKWVAASVAAAAITVGVLPRVAPRLGPSIQAQSTPSGLTITVDGNGQAFAVPDEAIVSLGVTERGSDAQSALASDNQKMQAVIAALKNAGVAAADIRTVDLSVGPVYGSGRPGSPPAITGFQASDQVAATVHDTGKVGGAVDAAMQAGANQVSGIQFAVQNEAAVRAQALKNAMQDAKAAAQTLAGAGGLTIAGVHSITENVSNCCQPRPFTAAVAAAGASGTPVEAGQQAVTASVRVIYDVTR